jgi:hypothetical protein
MERDFRQSSIRVRHHLAKDSLEAFDQRGDPAFVKQIDPKVYNSRQLS